MEKKKETEKQLQLLARIEQLEAAAAAAEERAAAAEAKAAAAEAKAAASRRTKAPKTAQEILTGSPAAVAGYLLARDYAGSDLPADNDLLLQVIAALIATREENGKLSLGNLRQQVNRVCRAAEGARLADSKEVQVPAAVEITAAATHLAIVAADELKAGTSIPEKVQEEIKSLFPETEVGKK